MTERKVDRRVRRTKRLFQEALLDLMGEQDFSNITVTDIVAQAEYNRATFYRYYDDKDQLVKEIILEQIATLIEAFKYPYKKSPVIDMLTLSPDDIIVFEHIYANKRFYRLWKKFVALPHFKDTFLQSLTRFFKEDIERIVSGDRELDHTLYTSFYANGILGIIIDWIENDLKPSPEQMAKQLVKILNHDLDKTYITDSMTSSRTS
ncbi:TetR/AcrR family transcriptional regulator [Lentibacillus saliphilus]|uniref:TetR/AcrR family transcriptional regulator n=1 Tax=Lentibacillus saliphilus TaxID=2737028 RepID=UPI001C307076|nr:TetR/AcrR family transcriptional regulator [Lentibacillus saliphilus]